MYYKCLVFNNIVLQDVSMRLCDDKVKCQFAMLNVEILMMIYH